MNPKVGIVMGSDSDWPKINKPPRRWMSSASLTKCR